MCKINLVIRARDEWRPSESKEIFPPWQLRIAAVPTVGSHIDLGPVLNDIVEQFHAEVVTVIFPVTPDDEDVQEPTVIALLSYEDGVKLLIDIPELTS